MFDKVDELKSLFCKLYDDNTYYRQQMQKIDCNPYNDNPNYIYQKIPYITKREIILQGDNYFTQKSHDIIYSTITSGTSGQVLECRKSKQETTNMAFQLWKKRRNIDPLVTPENYINIFSDATEELIGHFYNLSSPILIDNFYKIMELKPRWLSGPISIFEKFAYLIENGDIKYEKNIKIIEFMGEYVDPKKRKYIEKIFDCRTINHYGTQEIWCIAYECIHQNLHIMQSCTYLDIINKNRDGFGDIVLTSLKGIYMPFVKYLVGDLGKISAKLCPCGESDPVLELASNRKNNIIYNKNILGDYFFDQIFWDVNQFCRHSVFAFCVIQKSANIFNIEIVKGSNYTKKIEKIICDRMVGELGSEIKIIFNYVESIRCRLNGKAVKFIPYNPMEENL